MKIGVIIGRFQVPNLHEAHKALLDQAIKENDHVLVLLGCSRKERDNRDPLDFLTRQLMFSNIYPNINVLPIYDTGNNVTWSQQIDSLLGNLFPKDEITLYGGRKSFLTCGAYLGKFKTQKFIFTGPISEILISGTNERKQIACSNSKEFRKGMIYAQNIQKARSYQTVDIAVICKNVAYEQILILLGKKAHEDKWRLPGGFVDVNDLSLESAAARELFEETNIDVSPANLNYLGSYRGDDWRYNELARDKIMTCLYSYVYSENALVGSTYLQYSAKDDLAELNFYELKDAINYIMPNHENLLKVVMEKYL